MLYYTLLPSSSVAIGERAAEPEGTGCLPADIHPRRIDICNVLVLWDEQSEIEYVLDGRIALVGVTPLGEVTPSTRIDGRGTEVECAAGWRVESHLSLDEVLGPDAHRIRQVVATPMNLDQEKVYGDAVALDEELYGFAVHAVFTMCAANRDGWWWSKQVSGTRGYELVALAASDLVDESPESLLTEKRFHRLMGPWSAAMSRSEPAPDAADASAESPVTT